MRTNIVIIALTLGLLLIPAMTSASGTVLKVIPSSIDASAGEAFSVDVVLDPDGTPVYGVQYDLIFDTTSLEFVNQTAGAFLSHDGANTIEILNKFNEESKRIEYGETRMGVETGVTAAGTLARITFRVIGDRGSHLDFTEVIVAGPAESGTLPVSIENGVCLVDGIAPTSTPEPTATATEGQTSTPSATETVTATATMTETATSTPEPESILEDASAPVSMPPAEQSPAEDSESVHDSTPPENTSGFGAIMAYAGILMVSYVLRRRKI
jgi:hypothetical protein